MEMTNLLSIPSHTLQHLINQPKPNQEGPDAPLFFTFNYKSMNRLFSLIAILLLIGCSAEKTEMITHKSDYVHFYRGVTPQLVSHQSLEQEIAFWEGKISDQPNGYIYYNKLAVAKSKLFESNGDVALLKQIDSLYLTAGKMVAGKRKAANYIALSSNAIKQHKFQPALDYAYAAMDNTDEKFGPSLMVFDAAMELGLYDLAERMLKVTKNLESFDYLVRLSKFQDYKGDLDSAIVLMESAFDMVKSKNHATALWAQANLADMYGHAGEIDKSYQNYLAVLEKNPDYNYALKGIAWVAYAHDNKVDEAREIVEYLVKQKAMPDHHLLLAELAEYQGDNELHQKHIQLFESEASKAKYNGMYDAHLADLYASEFGDYDKALTLAHKELKKRPTPAMYALLAWVYELLGDHKKALAIIEEHVENKSFEPELIYKSAVIYASNNMDSKAKEYFLEAKDAGYELGPVVSQEVDRYLQSM